MSSYSLLDHLAPSYSSHRENLSTEALLYLLRRYENVRRAFISLVSDMGPALLLNDLVFTSQQRTHGNKGIPDLVGKNENGESVLLIEAKFWAHLTNNQPVGYLRRLPKNKSGILLFIAPEKRQEELWNSLVRRCKEVEMTLSNEMEDSSGWRRVEIDGIGTLALMSWKVLIGRIKFRLKEVGDTQGEGEIWQLEGLCSGLEEPFIIENSPGSEERKAQLISLTKDVARRLSKAGVFATKGYRATPGSNFYRRFGTLAGSVNWSIGFDEGFADRFNESLLCIRGPRNDKWSSNPPNLPQASGLRFYKFDRRLWFPLNVPEQTAREAIIQSLFDQVMSVVKLLQEREDQRDDT